MSVEKLPRIFLQAKRARPFFGRHPWVFESAIERIEGTPEPGSQVRVDTFDKEFIAYGLYNPHSKIRVRLYSWDRTQPFSEAMLTDRIAEAVRFRHETLGLADPQGGCRLVFSESDGLSGLTVDRYADVLVVQFTGLGLAGFESLVVAKLNELLHPRTIVRRTDRNIGELEGLDIADAVLAGDPNTGSVSILENGMRFAVDPAEGQKTGAYLDQRDNRVAIRRYAKNRHMLDVFCHGAGFGISAIKAGAKSLTAIDISGSAIALAQKNVDANDVGAEFINADAVSAMEQLRRDGRRFGLVVCDPPKFARTAGAIENARRGYERINRLAIDL